MDRMAFVMAGGGGERFWPLSTPERPKQLLRLASPDESLLQEAVSRLLQVLPCEAIHVATAAGLEDAIRGGESRLPAGNFTSEPTRRNTLGCMVWTAAHARARHHDDVVLAYLTADHRIVGAGEFRAALESCLAAAERHDALVTIGVRPSRPETGYGYIEPGERLPDAGEPLHRVGRFHEKPSRELAGQYLASGFLWNSGMFFWRLSVFERELRAALPEAADCREAIVSRLRAGDALGAAEAFARLPSISIDHALLEKCPRRLMALGAFLWDDMGSWDALGRTRGADPDGNVLEGEACLEGTRDSIVCNHAGKAMKVAVIGAEGLVVVVTDDAVLVVPKDRAQEVRAAARHWAGK